MPPGSIYRCRRLALCGKSTGLFFLISIVVLYAVCYRLTSNITNIDHKNHAVSLLHESPSTSINEPPDSKLLAFIFTTFRYSKSQEQIYNNTLRNWSILKPYVKPILYYVENEITAELLETALKYGWQLEICSKTKGGVPILKHMFLRTIKRHKAPFYIYANADILFTRNLIETLKVILQKQQPKPVLAVGRRINYAISFDEKDLWKLEDVEEKKTKGSLFVRFAMDYFITTPNYPWIKIPDFVVGRVVYDNWLLGHSILADHFVIDATDTITALHQTGVHGVKAGWSKTKRHRCLNYLIGGKNITAITAFGGTHCAPYKTKRGLASDNSLIIAKRQQTICFEDYKKYQKSGAKNTNRVCPTL